VTAASTFRAPDGILLAARPSPLTVERPVGSAGWETARAELRDALVREVASPVACSERELSKQEGLRDVLPCR
jgi:hypothetical protein